MASDVIFHSNLSTNSAFESEGFEFDSNGDIFMNEGVMGMFFR